MHDGFDDVAAIFWDRWGDFVGEGGYEVLSPCSSPR